MEQFFELLKSIPSSAWIAFFTALLTSTLTLIGVRLTNKSNNERLSIQLEHERKLKREELIRNRLEELYVESRRYMNAVVTHFLPYRQVMEGELTFNQALDFSIDSEYTHNPERVHLIMDMYFPELRDSFAGVEQMLEKTNNILHGYKLQYKQGDFSGEKWLPLFQDSLERLSKAANDFEKHVQEIAKKT
ncbi:hypothetical protein [Salinicola tamaricis]|uniref:hypothetical protein n=1 Tax=Salinicola tamaricis TaxID=1771309 RepID=UPI00101AD64F|nr:hypothetical protein [Salinicola tamaricis]